MYPVKVKDYTRLCGWLALFAVLTALCSVNCLLALVRIPLQLATYGTYGMGLYYVLEGINLVVGALGAACIVLLAQRKGAVLRRMFLITGAVNVSAFGLELAGLIAFSAHSQVIAQSALSSVQQVAFYGIWYLYLLRSRRVAVYFGEAQPMWYECGQPGPCGAQPPYGAPGQSPYGYGPQGPGAQPVPPQSAYAPPAAPQPPQAPPQQAAAPFAYQPQAAQSSVPPAQPAPTQATPAQPGAGAMVCPACGMQGAPGASFCTVCGAHLVPAAQARHSQRRGSPMCETQKPRPAQPGAPLPFEAVTNFRELGGYEAAGGRHVKCGVFYRAPALANVKTPHDVALYKSLGVHTVFDLRSAAERTAWPDPSFGEPQRFDIHAITSQDGQEVSFDLEAIFRDNGEADTLLRMVRESYATMPFANEAYHALLRCAAQGAGPILFHCTAGKDRTGVAAMLLLKALGASDETALFDFEQTNVCNAAAREAFCAQLCEKLPPQTARTVAQVATGVQRENLVRTMQAVRGRYGTFEAYFEAEHGLDARGLAALRNMYLE